MTNFDVMKELQNQLEESLKEKDDLKLKLEKFETSSKNLTNLINSQIIPKDKTGLGFDSQLNERDLNNKSDVFESASDSSVIKSKEDNNQPNDRYKAGEGYHTVPLPYTGNFMPPRLDISFVRLDDSVFKSEISETVTSVHETKTNASKTSKESMEKPKSIRPSALIIKDWESDSDDDYEIRPSIEQKNLVMLKSILLNQMKILGNLLLNNSHISKLKTLGKVKILRDGMMTQRLEDCFEFKKKSCFGCGSLYHLIKDLITNSGNVLVNTAKQSSPRVATSTSTARYVNTVATTLTMNGEKPSLNVFHKLHLPVKRTFNQRTAPKSSDLKETINNAKVTNITTASTKALVCAVQGNGENVVKYSTRWIWRPTRKVIDHISKDNRSYMLKRFNYVDLQGKLKSAMAWVPKRNQFSYFVCRAKLSTAMIPRYLKLEDSDGISTLPNTEIFEQLALIGINSSVESYHIPSGALTTSQPPLSSPFRIPTRQETKVPQPSSSTHTHVADEAASTGVDVRHRGAATTVSSLNARQCSGNIDKTPSMPYDSPLPRVNTHRSDKVSMTLNELTDLCIKMSQKVESLEADLKQTKKVYGAAYTKLIMKVKKLEKTVKSSQVKRRAKIVVSDNEELEDPSKQGRREAQSQESQPKDQLGVFNAAKVLAEVAKVHTILEEEGQLVLLVVELVLVKNQLVLPMHQCQLVLLRIARVHEEASSFNAEEWEDIQATIEADEELALRIQAEEREKYSEAKKARLIVDLINQRKRHFAQQSAKEMRNKPMTQAQQRTYMSNYVKHMGSHTLKQLKKLSFEELKNLFEATIKRKFDRDDLVQLWSLVKERLNTTYPIDDKEKELWVELKRLFEPDVDDTLWKLQRAYDFNVGKQVGSRTIFRDGK
nr:hypothetical protein [Tanacetum cinerariifolium]